jgi:hypothetical protein
VREDTVCNDFGRGGVDALKATVTPGPLPVKSETALRVITPLLEEPVADWPNWTNILVRQNRGSRGYSRPNGGSSRI